jgi:iron complex outermembrane recepter protein
MSQRISNKPRFQAIFTIIIGMSLSFSSFAQNILEEVIVTAQKREQNIQDVPISIGTMNEENFNATVSAGGDILALSARLPSLYIESSNGRLIPRFYIRGLGNVDFDINASQPVSMVYDDVVLENPAAKGFPLFDIERVEVLRGPQGSLFGRNTTAGIVKFDSRRPTDELDGYFAASYGRYDQRTVEGAVGGKLTEDGTLMGRVSLFYNGLNDWIDNKATGYEENNQLGGFEDIAGRVQLLWEPNDQFSALINVHGRVMDDGTPTLFRGNVITPGTNELIPGFERDEIFLDAGTRQSQEQNQYGIIANMSYDMGSVTATSITGFHTVTKNISHGDIDGGFGAVFLPPTGPGVPIPFDAETADALSDHEQFTQEFRLSSNDWGTLNWQVGFYYFDEQIQIDTINFESLIFAPGAVDGFVRQNQNTEAWAIFGSLDYQVSDQLTVTAGLRYSDDDKDLTVVRTIHPLAFLGPFFGPIGPLDIKTGDSVVTGDISANYAMNDDVNLYARFARGHRAPSLQGRLLFQDGLSEAKTEKNHSFEGGFKSELMDGRMRLNVAGFYYEISDQQLTKVGGAFNFNELINADKTEGYGFEIDMEYVPSDNWLFTGGLSYNHTEIDDPNLTANACGSAANIQGCTPTDPVAANGELSLDGNSLYNAPKWIGNWSARYGHPFAGGEIFVHTDWAYRSKIHFTLYNAAEHSDDSMLEGGVRLGYITADGKYQISAFGRNITNDESLIGVIDFNNLTGFTNNPPMWGIEFRAQLGN